MMRWWAEQARWAQWFVSLRGVLITVLVIDLAAYVGGLIFWYGYVMARPETPLWAWLFIPDCPLFGLLGGLGLLMVVARDECSAQARTRAQWALIAAGTVTALAWLSTYGPGADAVWIEQRAMLGVLAWVLLLVGALFRRAPLWLLGIFAFGQIKYGIWTVTAWSLFWKSTAEILGAPLFSPESVLMTVAHVGLAAQGILLLTYFRPSRFTALVALAWFGMSDFVDYGLGFFPAIPQELISLAAMQYSTIAVTLLLAAAYWFWPSATGAEGKRLRAHGLTGERASTPAGWQ